LSHQIIVVLLHWWCIALLSRQYPKA